MTEWNEVQIGKFLKRIKRPIDIDPDEEYQLVTIKLHHKGVHSRCLKKGGDIRSKMYEVKSGDFILSGIDARNGAFGIVPEELDGAIVTNDFWYFSIDEELIDKHFFLELTRTNWFDEICRLGSDGTTQRIRLQKDRFFKQKVLLPSIQEQKKLAKQLTNIKNRKSELTECQIKQLSFINQLRQQILKEKSVGTVKLKYHVTNLTKRINESVPNLRIIGVSNSDGVTDLTTSKKDGFEKYKLVEKYSFIYNPMRINVGSIVLYEDDEMCITSPDYVVFKISSQYPINALLFFLKSKRGLQEISENVQGSVRQRLYFENLGNINIPEFTLEDCKAIERLFSQLDELEEHIAQREKCSEILMQVFLENAFKN